MTRATSALAEVVRALCDRRGSGADRRQTEELVEIKHPADADPVLSPEQAERLRAHRGLMRELDVNVAGVEVILHMHEDLRSMQRQFNEVLQAVVSGMRRRLAE